MADDFYYTGWRIENRGEVLTQLDPPLFDRVYLNHVTWMFPRGKLPPEVSEAAITTHYASDGVECFLIQTSSVATRPDGKPLHVTYSVDQSHEPKDSLDAIEYGEETVLQSPIALVLTPARLT